MHENLGSVCVVFRIGREAASNLLAFLHSHAIRMILKQELQTTHSKNLHSSTQQSPKQVFFLSVRPTRLHPDCLLLIIPYKVLDNI